MATFFSWNQNNTIIFFSVKSKCILPEEDEDRPGGITRPGRNCSVFGAGWAPVCCIWYGFGGKFKSPPDCNKAMRLLSTGAGADVAVNGGARGGNPAKIK